MPCTWIFRMMSLEEQPVVPHTYNFLIKNIPPFVWTLLLVKSRG
jgi:hypothetical protein